jgi:hypothetical protein
MENVACRNGLYLYAPENLAPRIFVPPQARAPLIRFTHARMFHLGHVKVAERLAKRKLLLAGLTQRHPQTPHRLRRVRV